MKRRSKGVRLVVVLFFIDTYTMDELILIAAAFAVLAIYFFYRSCKEQTPIEKADKLAKERNVCSHQSNKFYRRGQPGRAKHYSKQADSYNEEIFNTLNPPEQSVQLIDLHRLYVDDAMKQLQKRIDLVKRKNLSSLIIIVGKGNHSGDGPKLKPAVVQFAQHQGFRHKFINAGRIQIALNNRSIMVL